MLLAGHVGTTLGVYALANRRRQSIPRRTLAAISVVALLPDVFDRTLRLVVPEYTTHGVFHSVFFYAAAVPAAYLLFRPALRYVLVMALHVLCDTVSTDLRVFVYPLYGWTGYPPFPPVLSPIDAFLIHWPRSIGYMLPTSHYLIFELIGLALIVYVGSETIDEVRVTSDE